MYNDSQSSDITLEELINIFSELSETDKQIVRDFIYSIGSSSEHEQSPDPLIQVNWAYQYLPR